VKRRRKIENYKKKQKSRKAYLGQPIPAQALFGTRVFVGISGDNPLEYWVKPLPSPNPHKTPPTIH
jgi:hypothetical protein